MVTNIQKNDHRPPFFLLDQILEQKWWKWIDKNGLLSKCVIGHSEEQDNIEKSGMLYCYIMIINQHINNKVDTYIAAMNNARQYFIYNISTKYILYKKSINPTAQPVK